MSNPVRREGRGVDRHRLDSGSRDRIEEAGQATVSTRNLNEIVIDEFGNRNRKFAVGKRTFDLTGLVDLEDSFVKLIADRGSNPGQGRSTNRTQR